MVKGRGGVFFSVAYKYVCIIVILFNFFTKCFYVYLFNFIYLIIFKDVIVLV